MGNPPIHDDRMLASVWPNHSKLTWAIKDDMCLKQNSQIWGIGETVLLRGWVCSSQNSYGLVMINCLREFDTNNVLLKWNSWTFSITICYIHKQLSIFNVRVTALITFIHILYIRILIFICQTISCHILWFLLSLSCLSFVFYLLF